MNSKVGKCLYSRQVWHRFALLLLLLVLPSCTPTQEKDWGGVSVTGRIADDTGRPVPEARVYAYREDKTSILGPADAMSEPTDADGNYLLILPPGTYTLAARKRVSGSISGPMKSGDMTGRLSNPLRAGPDDRTGVDIYISVFRQGLEGDPKRIIATGTRVKGVVIDSYGRAYPGILVFAYDGPFRQDPPDHLALPTDIEGRFEISLPGGGVYTIGARSGGKGKPQPNDSIGFWGEKDQPRVIEGGTVTEGVRIVVMPYGEKP